MAGLSIAAKAIPALIELGIERGEEECLIIEHLLIAPEKGGSVFLAVLSVPSGAGLVAQEVLEAAGQRRLRAQKLLEADQEGVVGAAVAGNGMEEILELE